MEPSLGQNRLEDVSWLCSLSESELDLLISLKKLVLQRARMVGHEELAEKFDLKMLRALGVALFLSFGDTLVAYHKPKSEEGWVLGRVFFWFSVWEGVTVPNPTVAFVLMECIKDKVKDLPLIPGSDNSAAYMESCNLLKCNLSDIMSLEEIKTCIGVDLRKGATKRLVKAASTIALFCRHNKMLAEEWKTNSKIK